MVSERALEVLRVIVEDYVESREPVGSKKISMKHGFGVSPATIRNDMAALEEAQLIHAPHTSAGRVPTDLGYRHFVDNIGELRPLSKSQLSAIHRFLDESLDLDDFYSRTVRLLSDLTRQVAIVQVPNRKQDYVARIELVQNTRTRAIAVLITNSGEVERRSIDFHTELSSESLAKLTIAINEAVAGCSRDSLITLLDELADRSDPGLQAFIHALGETFSHFSDEVRNDRLLIAGTPMIVRAESDFAGSIAPVLDAIEEQVMLLRLFAEMRENTQQNGVRIGRELSAGLDDAAVVSSAYSVTGSESGRVAVLGPTRMNYSLNMAAVDAVANYLSRVLGDEA